ncbi:MAG: hypothetical protein JRC77_04535, partial [Deltaproteobacteria bacterium]|nr:hypothetical protein [Deltaproteobacteria bacterium]
IKEARFKLRIFPLLAGKIRLREAKVLGLDLDLPLSQLPEGGSQRLHAKDFGPFEPLWPGLFSEWELPLGLVSLQLQESRIRLFNQPGDGDEEALVFLQNINFEAQRRTLRHDTLFEISADTEDAAGSRGRGSFHFKGATSKSFTGHIEIDRAEFGPTLRWLLENRNLRGKTDESTFRSRGKISGFIDIDLDASRAGKCAIRLKTEAVELSLPGGGPLESLKSRETNIVGTLALDRPSVSFLRNKQLGYLDLGLSVDDISIKLRESIPSASGGSSPEPVTTEQVYFDNVATNGVLRFSNRRLSLEAAKIETAEMRIDLEGSLGLPLRDNSPIEFSFLLEELGLDQLIEFLDHLPPGLRARTGEMLSGAEAGILHDFTVNYESHLKETAASFEALSLADLAGLGIGFRLSEGSYRFASGETMKDLQGEVQVHDDTIQISGLSATHSSTPLPVTDVSIEGLSRLLREESVRPVNPGPVGPIPGVEPLLGIIFPTKPNPHRKLRPVNVEIDWIYHPTLLWPVENLHAQISPKKESIDFSGATLTWGGKPIIIDGHLQKLPEPHLVLAIRTQKGKPRPIVRPNEDIWIQGRWNVTNGKIGPWPYHRYGGSFAAIRDTVDVELEILLQPEGKLSSAGVLRLSDTDSVPLTAEVKLEDGDIAKLGNALTRKKSRVTGTLHAELTGGGKLVPGDSILHHTTSTGTLLARDGRVTTRLPLLVSIAKASESFNPFGSRKYLDYTYIEGEIAFIEGDLAWERLAFKGPDIRLLLSGRMGVIEKDPPVEAIVGVLMFGKVDAVISKIPLVNFILLGEDKNLLGTYFKVTGTRSNLKSRIIPTKALTFGPTDLVFGGLPDYMPDEDDRVPQLMPWRKPESEEEAAEEDKDKAGSE